MASAPLRSRALPRAALPSLRLLRRLAPLQSFVTPALLGALLLFSLTLRSRDLGVGFWIDEGLSVGIASHPFLEIPGVLRQDGSPPLYYMILHVWMAVVGRSEESTHLLSLLFALACVPAGLWAGWSVFGWRVGWFCAVMCALTPFLTVFSAETRMYTLVTLLSVLATGAFLHAFLDRRRRFLPVFAGLLTLMVYTHNWCLFFAVATAAVVLARLIQTRDRSLLRDALLAYGAVALLYAPWLPTLLFQAQHTGAPWSERPTATDLLGSVRTLLGGQAPALVLLLAGGAGLSSLIRGQTGRLRRLVLVVIALAAGTVLLGWLSSQVAPAFTTRYLGVALGPLLLLGAMGLVAAGRLGLVGIALLVVFWANSPSVSHKNGTRDVLAQVKPVLEPGDVVLTTHPERTASLHYYLPDGLRYVTPLGPVPDPTVQDWRDVLPRLQAARPSTTLEPLIASLRPGTGVLLVRPVIGNPSGWTAPWTSLVRRRSAQWARALARDRRLTADASFPRKGSKLSRQGIRAILYTKVSNTPIRRQGADGASRSTTRTSGSPALTP